MKKKKYLPFYKEWIESERINKYGLCRSIGKRNLALVTPTIKDRGELSYEGMPCNYWGYGFKFYDEDNNNSDKYAIDKGFTPLRQNIVLLLAAINNEL